jgi:hypothetical protein
MNMMNTMINKYTILFVLSLVGFLFWFFVFSSFLNDGGKKSGTEYDKLSDTTVSLDAVNSAETPNPYLPFFAGFESLTDFGVSNDDMRYIQDVLINYTLYGAHIKSGKISYVKDSFKNEKFQGLDNVYSFKFGLNDRYIHTLRVTSNSVSRKITLVILDSSGKQVFNRTFDIYSI